MWKIIRLAIGLTFKWQMHVHANKDVRKDSYSEYLYIFGKVIHGDNSVKYASQENEATHIHLHVPGRKGFEHY